MFGSWHNLPSRSDDHEQSGLPMISLTLSSSKSDSIGRRNGRINSKLIAGASLRWKPSHLTGLPRVRMRALCGHFFLSRVIVILIFRRGFFGAIELEDRRDPDFPDALLRVRFLALVFAAAQLAFYLNMRALRERLGELRELAEYDATVPFRVRDIFAVLFVGRFGCQRKSRDADVWVVGTSFWVAAEEADERYFVLIHDCVSVS